MTRSPAKVDRRHSGGRCRARGGEGRQYIFRAPGLTMYPGLVIFLAVLGFNLFGDGLRDALDPRMGQL